MGCRTIICTIIKIKRLLINPNISPIFIQHLYGHKRIKGLNIAKKRAGEAKYNVQYLNVWPLIKGINHPIKKGKPKAIKYPNSRNCFLVIFSVKI